jgi:hypothetical protein
MTGSTITVTTGGAISIRLGGPKGEKGDTGDPGSSALVWRGEWSDAATYTANDYVSNPADDLLYICILGHAPSHEPPNATYWAQFIGPAGADGKSLLNGASAPTTQGNNGDFYLETTHTYLYGPKSGGAWPETYVVLIGTTGATGAAGTDGLKIITGTVAPTTEGVNGDCYINTATMMFYGPKAAGVWPAGTTMVGSTGAAGADGTQIYETSGLPLDSVGVAGDYAIDSALSVLYGPKTTTWAGTSHTFKGDTGNPGSMAWQGPWVATTYSYANKLVSNPLSGYGDTCYICILGHTAGSDDDEPGVGANTATYWEVYAGGGEDGVGTGDVIGPASATSGRFAEFDGTTGKLIKVSSYSYASFLLSTTKLDQLAAPTDVTTLNVSNTVHGLCPKHPNTATAFLGGDGAWHYFVDNETPSGDVNSSNVTFVLAHTPITGSLHLVVDGLAIYATDDYTLATATLTLVSAPVTKIKASYRY